MYANPVDIPLSQNPFGNPGGGNALFTMLGTPDGRQHQCQIDTGSTGIVVPYSFLCNGGKPENGLMEGVVSLGPAQITYFPSTDQLNGCYYYVPCLYLGLNADGSYACQVGPLVVLGAHESGTAANPGINKNPQVGMMGVGFGRPGMGFIVNAPENHGGNRIYRPTNPFLAAGTVGTKTTPSQALYPSYYMTSKGASDDGVFTGYVTLGIQPAAITAAPYDCKLSQLDQTPAPTPLNVNNVCNCSTPAVENLPPVPAELPYWTSPLATVTVGQLNGGKEIPATALLDTGVNLMMMSIPSIQNWALQISSATVTVAIPNVADAIMSYSFDLGPIAVSAGIDQKTLKCAEAPKQFQAVEAIVAPTPMPTPTQPIPTPPSKDAAFVNTGINVLNSYNYYFDGLKGSIGFAANSSTNPA